MAEVASYDMTILQGATLRRIFVWQDEAGDPIPLAGWRARMQVRNKPGGDVLVSITSEDGGILLAPNGADGEIHIRIGANLTDLILKSGFYDIEMVSITDPTEVKRLVQGRAILSKQVTA